MYNGIGLPTPRGSGTNGYVQRNFAFVRNRKEKVDYKTEEDLKRLEASATKKPNQEILDHERKRKIELKCIELSELMEEQGYCAEEIERKVSLFRQMLMDEGGGDKSEGMDEHGRPSAKGTHQMAKANQEKNQRLREAFGISEYFVEGSSLDPERKRKEAEAKAVADQKRYTLLRDSSPESPSPHRSKRKKKRSSNRKDRSESPSPSRKDKKKKSKKQKRDRSESLKKKKKSKDKSKHRKRKKRSNSESSDKREKHSRKGKCHSESSSSADSGSDSHSPPRSRKDKTKSSHTRYSESVSPSRGDTHSRKSSSPKNAKSRKDAGNKKIYEEHNERSKGNYKSLTPDKHMPVRDSPVTTRTKQSTSPDRVNHGSSPSPKRRAKEDASVNHRSRLTESPRNPKTHSSIVLSPSQERENHADRKKASRSFSSSSSSSSSSSTSSSSSDGSSDSSHSSSKMISCNKSRIKV